MDTVINDKWPTRDHHMPFKLFVLYARALSRLRLSDQLDASWSVAHGYLGARLPKKDRFIYDAQEAMMRKLARPLVWPKGLGEGTEESPDAT